MFHIWVGNRSHVVVFVIEAVLKPVRLIHGVEMFCYNLQSVLGLIISVHRRDISLFHATSAHCTRHTCFVSVFVKGGAMVNAI